LPDFTQSSICENCTSISNNHESSRNHMWKPTSAMATSENLYIQCIIFSTIHIWEIKNSIEMACLFLPSVTWTNDKKPSFLRKLLADLDGHFQMALLHMFSSLSPPTVPLRTVGLAAVTCLTKIGTWVHLGSPVIYTWDIKNGYHSILYWNRKYMGYCEVVCSECACISFGSAARLGSLVLNYKSATVIQVAWFLDVVNCFSVSDSIFSACLNFFIPTSDTA
jgi:hypothetical protein